MGLSDTLIAKPPPLRLNGDRVLRVGGTRVTLDTVVEAFEEGASAEEIALQYPALHLADVYAAIGYYLEHRGEVEAYLEERGRQAEEARRLNEIRSPSKAIRERLLARREAGR